MGHSRAKDRLVGAVIALVLLLVAAAVFLLWVSSPATDVPPTGASAADRRPGAGAPSDLAAGETWLGELVLRAGTVVTTDSPLRDVRAVARDVRAGPRGLQAGTLTVEATVPFDEVARQLGEGNTVTAEGRSARLVRTVDIGGRRFRVVSTGTVDVEAGRLVVHPRSIDVGGPALLAEATADLARKMVTIEHTVEGLPDGMELEQVSVQEDGFRARLRGQDVRLAAPS